MSKRRRWAEGHDKGCGAWAHSLVVLFVDFCLHLPSRLTGYWNIFEQTCRRRDRDYALTDLHQPVEYGCGNRAWSESTPSLQVIVIVIVLRLSASPRRLRSNLNAGRLGISTLCSGNLQTRSRWLVVRRRAFNSLSPSGSHAVVSNTSAHIFVTD